MSYISDLANPLIRTLERFVTLNPHQLAGQAANVDFWIGEVSHCYAVIDEYHARFERLKAGQTEYVARRKTIQFDVEGRDLLAASVPPPRPGISDQELKGLRSSLSEAAYRFLVRCHNAELLERPALDSALGRLGLSAEDRDLRR